MSDEAGPNEPFTPSLPPMPNLSMLDPTSRLILGGAVVALVAALLGALIGAWDSSDFLLVILAGGIAAALAAWFTATTSASPNPPTLPLGSIELAGAAVIAVLGVWRLIELVFDLDQLDESGGIFGVVLIVLLAGSGVAALMGALRRDPSIRRAAMTGDQGTRLAVGGLALVLLGWALNLSISYWTMAQAALTLAIATFAVVAIVVAPHWTKVLPGIPVAWVGAAFGILVALLALDQFGALGRLGNRTELGLTDYVPFLAYVVGVVGIIAGGTLAGQAAWQSRPRAPLVVAAAPSSPRPSSEPPMAPSEPPPSSEPPMAPSERPMAPSEPPMAPSEPPMTPSEPAGPPA